VKDPYKDSNKRPGTYEQYLTRHAETMEKLAHVRLAMPASASAQRAAGRAPNPVRAAAGRLVQRTENYLANVGKSPTGLASFSSIIPPNLEFFKKYPQSMWEGLHLGLQSKLGVMLAERAGMTVTATTDLRTLPAPDNNTIYVANSAHVSQRLAAGFATVVCSNDYHGKARYDNVTVEGPGGIVWYGKVLLLFAFYYMRRRLQRCF
jgi:hypothetical protein